MRTGPRRGARAVALAAALTMTGVAGMSGLGAAAVAADEPVPVEAGITVPRVDGMGEDWINGADFSSVLSLEESGVVFRDASGQPADVFEVLADAGVNYARIRVWNEPYSSVDPSLGYGAGNVDAERAVEIGRRATAAGMRVLVNFHYSDFWAHPGQQRSPRAWTGLDLDQRVDALHDYTADTLQAMADAGVDVGMVQIGNETTGGEIAGVSGWDSTARLFQAGSEAVRETLGPDVKVAVHFTNPERAGQYAAAAKALDDRGVDYDVFLSSYYAFWHGSLANLTAVLDQVATTYDKEVAVAETSWASTLEDGDGYPNVIRTTPTAYSASVQGQALAIRDVMQAVADVSDGRGIGTFYWEPAWLPVGPPEDVDANRVLWEQHGSGWAASHSAEFYAPTGEDYGGSSWDNQALFAFDGTPLESLRVYEYARTGSVGPRELDAVEQPRLTVVAGDPVTLPGTVRVSYTDGTTEDEAVTWQDDPAWLLGPGTYTFAGTSAGGHAVAATVTVLADAGVGENLVANGGFEDGAAPWTGTGTGYTISSNENPYAGARSLHFWSATPYTFTVEQTVTGVPAGQYRLSARAQGDGAGATDTLQISASSGISSVTTDFALAGWANWQHPQTDVLNVGSDGVVVVSTSAALGAGAWGSIDEVELVAVAPQAVADTAALRDLVDRAAAVDRAAYTAGSVAVLDAAVGRADFVLRAAAPDQATVDGAAGALTSALDGLVPVSGPTPGPGEPTPGEPTPGEPEPDTPTATVSATTVRAGGTVTLTLAGLPGEQVEVGVASVYQRLATVGLVDGGATVTVTIPADLAPGLHHLQVRDATGAVLVEVPITVLAAGGGALAATGAAGVGLAGAAALALVAGGVALLVRRRTVALRPVASDAGR
ncbi:glycosyl hydrolase 53 family protein [Cellulomonas triticagri]|uniref:Arabinogalactan endo-beta-1,4-galactanase n=1 Tax=Cellulomonas triticagri TaxID=2483352 RepID=A0A3M2IXP5_9CELL|nr:glycosyl hydrolase 53 family protein [Cellulomonas triticagri]RMI06697.1 arabinogalactan endo-1,4-beta-galactosidase [Cellulomonas triticagri]